MLRLSIEQMIQKIQAKQPFHAVALDYSFTLKIDAYSHYVCAAVHDGHQFRRELWEHCYHTAYERWYEEDPETKRMVQQHPIVIAGCDSRFEYDLNRDPETAVYEDAWGKKLWKQPLHPELKNTSLQKHTNFYKVVYELIAAVETIHGAAIVYDMHSYNWRRWNREVPVVNLGTKNIDNQKYGSFVDSWCQSLSEITLPNKIEVTAAINDTFQGNGYFLKFITQNFNNTLVLATEFSKIYCHELDYVIYPEVVASINRELQERLPIHATSFYQQFCHT